METTWAGRPGYNVGVGGGSGVVCVVVGRGGACIQSALAEDKGVCADHGDDLARWVLLCTVHMQQP
jgi:hypothetical protein